MSDLIEDDRWHVHKMPTVDKWYCYRFILATGSGEFWPDSHASFLDEGTAITMCDVLNGKEGRECGI